MKITVMAAALALTFVAAVADATPLDVVNGRYSDIKRLVARNMDRPSFDRAVKTLLDSFVDYEELSRRTLGDQWNSLRPADRKRFVEGFKKMIQRSYVRKFNPDTAFTVEINPNPEQKPDGSVIVSSTIHSGRSEANVNYAFHQVRGGWMAFDVIIDDVSMVRNYRNQFHKILRTEGFEGLMRKIDKKNTEAGA